MRNLCGFGFGGCQEFVGKHRQRRRLGDAAGVPVIGAASAMRSASS